MHGCDKHQEAAFRRVDINPQQAFQIWPLSCFANTRNRQPQTASWRWKANKDSPSECPPHLSHHAVPRPVDLLAVFAVGDQVKVVGELDRLGDLLQDVDAETLAAALDVNPRLLRLVAAQGRHVRPPRLFVVKSRYVCDLLPWRASAVSNR